MTGLVHALQIVVGLLWLIPLVLFAPALCRVWRKSHDTADLLVAAYPLIGFAQAGFSLRWLLYASAVQIMGSDELAYWCGLYAFSGLTVALTLIIARAWWRQ